MNEDEDGNANQEMGASTRSTAAATTAANPLLHTSAHRLMCMLVSPEIRYGPYPQVVSL
jgi:hypothetical protein